MVNFDWIQILVIIIEKECLRMNNERHLIFWLSKAKRISKTLFQNINQDLFKKCPMYKFFFRDTKYLNCKSVCNFNEFIKSSSNDYNTITLMNQKIKEKDELHFIRKSKKCLDNYIYIIRCNIENLNEYRLIRKTNKNFNKRTIVFISCTFINYKKEYLFFNRTNSNLIFISCSNVPSMKLENQDFIYIENCHIVGEFPEIIGDYIKRNVLDILNVKSFIFKENIVINKDRYIQERYFCPIIDSFIRINYTCVPRLLRTVDTVQISNCIFNLFYFNEYIKNYDNNITILNLSNTFKSKQEQKKLSLSNNFAFLNFMEENEFKPKMVDITNKSFKCKDKMIELKHICKKNLLDIFSNLNDINQIDKHIQIQYGFSKKTREFEIINNSQKCLNKSDSDINSYAIYLSLCNDYFKYMNDLKLNYNKIMLKNTFYHYFKLSMFCEKKDNDYNYLLEIIKNLNKETLINYRKYIHYFINLCENDVKISDNGYINLLKGLTHIKKEYNILVTRINEYNSKKRKFDTI